ncbi:MAG: twin-arginine translocation protein TatA/E family subunit [Massilibacillus sp.]|jgi:sec-independent protein translocase protein TatA|nr:twin-arginine translocation protein TatA/E family subunit [Massilibacillus sp.]
MHGIGIPEILVILVIGLVFFGPGKLPEFGKSLGNSINEFKKALYGQPKSSEPTKEESNKTETK